MQGIGRGVAIVVVWLWLGRTGRLWFYWNHNLEFGHSPGGFGSRDRGRGWYWECRFDGVCQFDKGRGFHRVLGAGRKVQVGGGLNP